MTLLMAAIVSTRRLHLVTTSQQAKEWRAGAFLEGEAAEASCHPSAPAVAAAPLMQVLQAARMPQGKLQNHYASMLHKGVPLA